MAERARRHHRVRIDEGVAFLRHGLVHGGQMTWRVDAQKLVARYGPGAQARQGVELRPFEGRQHGGDAGHALGVFLRRGVQVAVGVGD